MSKEETNEKKEKTWHDESVGSSNGGGCHRFRIRPQRLKGSVFMVSLLLIFQVLIVLELTIGVPTLFYELWRLRREQENLKRKIIEKQKGGI